MRRIGKTGDNGHRRAEDLHKRPSWGKGIFELGGSVKSGTSLDSMTESLEKWSLKEDS